jgi:hypothetical protein
LGDLKGRRPRPFRVTDWNYRSVFTSAGWNTGR